MKIFCTGASGYIGGSVAAHLVAAGHQVTGLVRSPEKADAVRARGIQPLLGTLDDAELLAQAAQAADVVVNAASADHKGAVVALLDALAGSGKPFIHTSGSSIVGTRARGRAVRCDLRRRHADHAVARARGAGRVERTHPLLPRQGLPSGHHLPEPDLRPRPWRRAAQHAGAAADRARQKARQRGPCRARREHLVERAYRRSRDALCARDREGAGRRVLFRRERREFDARGLRGHQPHAGLCGTANGDVDGRRRPPNGARAPPKIRWRPTAGCARSARGSSAGSRRRAA